ncbi:MAG: RNA methyltransferase [Clostridia bacterium]|nr:RNA methyltransferase [Clostridia bacterium]
MENITSKSNEKIKFAVSLKDSSSQRKKSGMFFAEGARLCCDAAMSGVDILQLFFTRKSEQKFAEYLNKILPLAKESFVIGEDVSAKLSDTSSPQGIFCVCRIPEKNAAETALNKKGKYIALENVQDPSNTGAVARTAEAMGLDGMIVCSGCDVYNPKALRASMGAFFRLNVIECSVYQLAEKAGQAGLPLAFSTPDADARKITDIDFSNGFVCITGNEGSGVSDEAKELCDLKITIPMRGRAESLNAATASAIMIWEMVRNGS